MSYAYDVRGYAYEGVFYCKDCADYDAEDPEWNPLFEENVEESDYGMCCGTCGHSMACVNGEYEHPCPCDDESVVERVS